MIINYNNYCTMKGHDHLGYFENYTSSIGKGWGQRVRNGCYLTGYTELPSSSIETPGFLAAFAPPFPLFLQPSWRAKPASWAVLRLFWITCVYIYIFMYVCTLWISSLLVVYDAIDNASSSRATRTEN